MDPEGPYLRRIGISDRGPGAVRSGAGAGLRNSASIVEGAIR
jgi:hypothetical protein